MAFEVDSVEETLELAREHDRVRRNLDSWFSPIVREWLDLHFKAGLITRDAAERGYGYEETLEDEVVFYSAALVDPYGRGDIEPEDEDYLHIPISFITRENDIHRSSLAEMIRERDKKVAAAENDRRERRESLRG